MQTEPPKADPPKRKRRWFQFSLRSLLIFVAICAIPCGWFGARMERATKQKAAVEAIVKAGGSVRYDYERDATGNWIPVAEPHAPKWLRNLLGDDFFSTVVEATAYTDVSVEHLNDLGGLRSLSFCSLRITDSGLRHLEELSQLEDLSFSGTGISESGLRAFEALIRLKGLRFYAETEESRLDQMRNRTPPSPVASQITDAGLEHVEGLRQLRYLMISGKGVTDAGMRHLKGLSQLRYLELDETLVGDHGLEDLRGLKQLGTLWLFKSQVTDVGMEVIKGLSDLHKLSLCGARVTDAGVQQLSELKNLQQLDIKLTPVTDQGVANLQRALPNCKIDRKP
jgi:hypothetical protein